MKQVTSIKETINGVKNPNHFSIGKKSKPVYRDFRSQKVNESDVNQLKWTFLQFAQNNMFDAHVKRFTVTEEVKPILSSVFNWVIGSVDYKDRFRGILLTGKIGLAKTTIMKAAIDLIAHLYPHSIAEYTTAFAIAKLHRQKDDTSIVQLNRIYSCGLLFIDDLGLEDKKVYDIKPLTELIHHRYDTRRITSFTTNLSSEELVERYSPTIEDKINHSTIRLEFEGESKRD